MSDLPTGTVAFLLTDIEGSSRLWDEHPDAMRVAIKRHHQIIHEEIDRHGGKRPADQGEGDSVLGAFARATDAVSCALDTQRRLVGETWPDSIDLRVRMAIHAGEAELRDPANYASPPINRAARVRSLAHGGQVLVSQSTWDLVRERPPESASFRDLGSHTLRGLTNPEQVFQLVHPDLPDGFPPLRGIDQLRTNFPARLTSLIGRDEEMRTVRKRVLEQRLVTITGAAGCGKTRLALEVGGDLMDEFPDGTWFVDLAPVSDPQLVSDTAAIAMGLELQSASALDPEIGQPQSADAAARMVEHIRSRRVLIVLDNCEHVIAASALLVDRLLRECANLRIVATSREPLGVAGEAAYRVPSLAFPDPGHTPPPEEIAGYDAVRLFVERAALAHGEFELTRANSPAISQIVGRLDGIPLAIELAAARAKALTPDQIAARLDDQFRLLTGGQRTALERQQTIRAAIDWSHQLLSEPERILLRRLSVFVGSFTLEAAEQICGHEGLERDDVLDLLGELVAKSLVIREEKGSTGWFRMLETIRQFGREKLVEAQEASLFRTRHRDHYLSVAEASQSGILSPEAGEWLETLEADVDNLRAAIEWSLSEEQGAEAAQRLASSLEPFWFLRGRSLEGRRWLEQAVTKEGEVSPAVRANAQSVLAVLDFHVLMNFESARRWAEESALSAEEAGVGAPAARSKLVLGFLALFEGNYALAESLFEEARSGGKSAGEPPITGQAQMGLIQIAFSRGDVKRARELSDEATRGAQTGGFPIGIVRTLSVAATLEEEAGNFGKARAHFEEALAGARALGDQIGEVLILGRITRLLEADGRVEEARAAWSQACALAREKSEGGWIYWLSQYALRRHDYEEARTLAEEALAIAREAKASLPIALRLSLAGWTCYSMAAIDSALGFLEEAEAIAREGIGKPVLAEVLHSLGEARRVAGGEAGPLLEEALEISREMGAPRPIGAALWSLGEMKRASGDIAEALRLHREALSLGPQAGASQLIQSLESIAGLLIGSHPKRSAQIFGAAGELRSTLLEPRPRVLQTAYAADLEAVRKALSEQDFNEAIKEGSAMSLEEAVAFAKESL